MKKAIKYLTAVCIAAIFAVQTAFSAAGESGGDYISLAEECFGFFTARRGAEDFWDGLEYGGEDWAAYCRARLFGTDGSESYAASAEAEVDRLSESPGFVKPTDYHRAALCISAAGGDCSRAVERGVFFNEELDRQGFNAYIWALITLSVTGAEPPDDALNTAGTLSEYIMSRQHEDGSFSLMGDGGDVDITAAAVYALAGIDIPEAEQAAQRGADWLSAIEGGYTSMGIRNCESTAQAVIALCAAGRAERAHKAAAELEEYRREGGYAHLPEGEVNGLATAQALEAFTALALLERGEPLFGAVPAVTQSTVEAPNTVQGSAEYGAAREAPLSGGGITGVHIKVIISAVLALAAAVCMVMSAVRRKKALIAAGIVFAALSGGVWLLDIKTPDEYYAQNSTGTMRVSVCADCSAALDEMDSIDPSVNPAEIIPEDGEVIRVCEVTLPPGASAFDALIAAAREQRVRVDYSGGVWGAYIRGIGGIYEFGFGELSGWMYRVNGEYPEVSASDYILEEGDSVEFVFTTNLGGDIGNSYTGETPGV